MTDNASTTPQVGLTVNRRTALGTLAAGAAIATLGESKAQAQTAADPAASSPVTMTSSPTAQSLGVTISDVAAAEKFTGQVLSDAQRKQVLTAVGDQVAATKAINALDLPNALAPAELFDPRLPGFVAPAQANGPHWPNLPLPPLPANDADVAYAPAWQHAGWMAAGVLTSRRLTEIYLARIALLNAKLLAYITVTPDIARAQADIADRERSAGKVRSPLHGLPYGVKDLFDTANIRTTWGAETTMNRVPTSDATVVTRLREAGAVLLGKTACGALANGDVWFGGYTRSPWNTDEGSSGSSAGTGSGVAAALMSFGIGTETMGSIVSPTSRNGGAGIRPSFGRVPRTGAMALCWSLDKTGPMARSTADLGAIMGVIAGDDGHDLGAVRDLSFGYDAGASAKGLRLGYDPQWFAGSDVSQAERDALAAAQKAGFTLVELSLPKLPVDPMNVIVTMEAAAAFEQLTLSGAVDKLSAQDDQAWPNIFRTARFLPAVSYIQAQRLRRQWMQAFADTLGKCDALIHPNYVAGLLVIGNCTGYPTVALRAGFLKQATRAQDVDYLPDDKQPKGAPRFKVPVSISVTGQLYQEGQLLNIATALEGALGVASQRPPIG